MGQVTTNAGPVPRAQERRVLALLLVNRNRPVSPHAVADALFGDSTPDNALSSVQTNVSRLRSLIGRDALLLRPAGYVLSVPDGGATPTSSKHG